ncbi:MAG: hypothetical protein J6C81_09125 [Muribaculaceae bacterium]|nr:hypothetical protein [Muribaculaceae bacterium]
MKPASIFTNFLTELGVPHTRSYSDRRFEKMTFKSLFGLSKLLQSYGVPNEAFSLPDKRGDLALLPVPFLAGSGESFVVVRSKNQNSVEYIDCVTGETRTLSMDDFIDKWSGVALVAYPTEESAEPSYMKHHLIEIAQRVKRWVLIAAVLFIFLYLFISNGIYAHVTTVLLTMIFCGGLYVTYELMLKSLHIHSERGDSICGLIDRTGCHQVLSTKASSFFGIFSWSEVGMAYFSVSLCCLLVFPKYLPYLALINACCCPFSFWSVWYQKYRAKAWCTLCLITQGCLWSALICFICGGWFEGSFPLRIEFFILGATYVAALLGINSLSPSLDRNTGKEDEL